MPERQGLDDEAIERETAVPLPERDALSIVGTVKLIPIEGAIATVPTEPDPVLVDPPGYVK